MTFTPELKKILSNYESDSPGTKANLARILMQGGLGGTGKLLILPVDQGFEHGPARSFAKNPAAYDPHYHFQLAIDAGLSAFAAPLGMIEAGAGTFAGKIPLPESEQRQLADGQGQCAGPGHHRLGGRRPAPGLHGHRVHHLPRLAPGLRHDGRNRDMAEEAKAAGLAVVIWSYPRGGNLSKDGETAMDICAYAAHMAACLAPTSSRSSRRQRIEQAEAKKVYESRKSPSARSASASRTSCRRASAGGASWCSPVARPRAWTTFTPRPAPSATAAATAHHRPQYLNAYARKRSPCWTSW